MTDPERVNHNVNFLIPAAVLLLYGNTIFTIHSLCFSCFRADGMCHCSPVKSTPFPPESYNTKTVHGAVSYIRIVKTHNGLKTRIIIGPLVIREIRVPVAPRLSVLII